MHVFATVLVFIGIAFTVVFSVWPIQLTFFKKFPNIYLSMSTAPFVSVALTCACGIISAQDIYRALLDSTTLKPLNILVLFMSMAYLCTSLDETGLLKAIALFVASKTHDSPKSLFICIFIISSVLTIFTSNDIVILVLTPIIASMKHVNPFPLLIAQFLAANTLSIMFYMSNPTNIIVADSFNIDFLSFARRMVPTALVAGSVLLIVLISVFFTSNSQLTLKPLQAGAVDWAFKWSDHVTRPFAAAISVIDLLGCLLCIAIAPSINASVGVITLVFACFLFLLDLGQDLYNITRRSRSRAYSDIETSKLKPPLSIRGWLPITTQNLGRLPWPIAPFLLGMFIMAEALFVSEFTSYAAIQIAKACGSSKFQSSFSVTWISIIAANLLNNQPMTILFSRIVQEPQFFETLKESNSEAQALLLKEAAIYGLIQGSNLAANITKLGALAGILWDSVLKKYEFEIPLTKFMKYGIPCMLFCSVSSCFVLSFQIN